MSSDTLALPPGFRVDSLRIDRVLGRGAFGITYLVTDTVLDSPFALKEYLPEALVNYLAILGWSPGDDETIVPLDVMVRRFDLESHRLQVVHDHPPGLLTEIHGSQIEVAATIQRLRM